MGFVIFEKKCSTCDGSVLGPRVGGKARGEWLGHDCCEKCREKADKQVPA